MHTCVWSSWELLEQYVAGSNPEITTTRLHGSGS